MTRENVHRTDNGRRDLNDYFVNFSRVPTAIIVYLLLSLFEPDVVYADFKNGKITFTRMYRV